MVLRHTILLNKTEFYNEGETKAPISIRHKDRMVTHVIQVVRSDPSMTMRMYLTETIALASRVTYAVMYCKASDSQQHLDQHRGCDETYERINDLLKEINITHLWYFWPMEIIAL